MNGPAHTLPRLAPLVGRGRIVSQDAIRVRGTLHEFDSYFFRTASPSPHPSPREGRGEGAVHQRGDA